MSRLHRPSDYVLICEGSSPSWDGFFIAGLDGRDGDPAPGDILVADAGGRPVRWSVVTIEHPYARFVGHPDVAVWAARVRPAAPALRLV